MISFVRLARFFSVSAVLIAAGGGAMAQNPPKLVGTWKGTAHAVHIGSNPYRIAEKTGPNLPDSGIEITYTITEQNGNRFAGTASGGKFTETIIGAIAVDGRSGVMLDDDGQYLIAVVDADTMDVCYNHTFPTSRVVGCWQIKRAAK